MPGERQAGVAFSFTPGILPSAFGPTSPFAPLLRRSGYFLLDYAREKRLGRRRRSTAVGSECNERERNNFSSALQDD